MRIPSVARNGFPGACRISSARPVRTGRSTQIGVVSLKPTSRPYSVARVASITCFWTSPYSET